VEPPTRSAIQTPVQGGEKLDVKDVSLTATFASLYAILVVVLAPISFGPVQLRVADCLIPLAALFGWPIVAGVTIGCFLGNAYYWIGVYDVVLGPIANLTAASVTLLLRKRRLLGCVVGALPIGFIVGGYLWLFFPPPDFPGLSLPPWIAMIVSITVSSLIAVAVIGYSLLNVLSRPNIIEPLKARGLRVVTEN